MLTSKNYLHKEHIGPAIAAFIAHSLVISAFALGGIYSGQGVRLLSKNTFTAQVVFTEIHQENQALQGKPVLENLAISKKPQLKKEGKAPQKSLPASAPTFPSLSGKEPLLLYSPPPAYPREAQRRKIQGVVVVHLYLTPQGTVEKALPFPPRTDPLLEEAALKAVRQWKFQPGVRDLEVPIEFKLS